MRLLVTGGRTGYLGRHVVDAASDHDVVAVGSGDADLRDGAAVESLVDDHRTDVIVHTAYGQSDWAIARRDGLDPSSLRSIGRAAARVAGPVDVRLDSTRASQVLTTRLRGAREFLRPPPRAPHP